MKKYKQQEELFKTYSMAFFDFESGRTKKGEKKNICKFGTIVDVDKPKYYGCEFETKLSVCSYNSAIINKNLVEYIGFIRQTDENYFYHKLYVEL